ncbi:unnamed protein product [Fraxinus pennsylvanica]|uniref:UspA domain-containing protein n=1 Tax=Fraxinus pennsylvanica TaxID=56036 RepID=A0AAD1YR75_9LAMI|nr:unnamed protein product [Fraxinus pennsylvanica]
MEGEKKMVMVAIDESECSLYALEWTLQKLHDSLLNSELVLFTVQPIVDYGNFYAASFGVISPEFLTVIQENQKKTATALLDKAKDICRDHGFCAETIIEAGDPKDVICEEVEKLKIELLVLGSHSRGALHRAFLGSVSNYCVHNAKCPVLVVKKKA